MKNWGPLVRSYQTGPKETGPNVLFYFVGRWWKRACVCSQESRATFDAAKGICFAAGTLAALMLPPMLTFWLPWPFGPFSLQTMCLRVSCGHWSLPKGSLLLVEKIDGKRSHMRWRNACVIWKTPGKTFSYETESLVRTNLWWDRISGEMRERMCHMKNPGKKFFLWKIQGQKFSYEKSVAG